MERSDGACNLGTRPQKQSSLGTVSLTDHAQCM